MLLVLYVFLLTLLFLYGALWGHARCNCMHFINTFYITLHKNMVQDWGTLHCGYQLSPENTNPNVLAWTKSNQ